MRFDVGFAEGLGHHKRGMTLDADGYQYDGSKNHSKMCFVWHRNAFVYESCL